MNILQLESRLVLSAPKISYFTRELNIVKCLMDVKSCDHEFASGRLIKSFSMYFSNMKLKVCKSIS